MNANPASNAVESTPITIHQLKFNIGDNTGLQAASGWSGQERTIDQNGKREEMVGVEERWLGVEEMTNIVFSLEEDPGVLFKAIAVFALRRINLTKAFAIFLRVLGSYPVDTNFGSHLLPASVDPFKSSICASAALDNIIPYERKGQGLQVRILPRPLRLRAPELEAVAIKWRISIDLLSCLLPQKKNCKEFESVFSQVGIGDKEKAIFQVRWKESWEVHGPELLVVRCLERDSSSVGAFCIQQDLVLVRLEKLAGGVDFDQVGKPAFLVAAIIERLPRVEGFENYLNEKGDECRGGFLRSELGWVEPKRMVDRSCATPYLPRREFVYFPTTVIVGEVVHKGCGVRDQGRGKVILKMTYGKTTTRTMSCMYLRSMRILFTVHLNKHGFRMVLESTSFQIDTNISMRLVLRQSQGYLLKQLKEIGTSDMRGIRHEVPPYSPVEWCDIHKNMIMESMNRVVFEHVFYIVNTESYKEVNSQESSLWKEAIKSEIDFILQNHAWASGSSRVIAFKWNLDEEIYMEQLRVLQTRQKESRKLVKSCYETGYSCEGSDDANLDIDVKNSKSTSEYVFTLAVCDIMEILKTSGYSPIHMESEFILWISVGFLPPHSYDETMIPVEDEDKLKLLMILMHREIREEYSGILLNQGRCPWPKRTCLKRGMPEGVLCEVYHLYINDSLKRDSSSVGAFCIQQLFNRGGGRAEPSTCLSLGVSYTYIAAAVVTNFSNLGQPPY
ncbi:hypothetical protein FNV43_RR05510 [Rhamnella rubrinervis]|uniref:Uncharacterized protein n=1 Tax=Rhamnella rubrinervis TaxID=2594499 RepID=A0A8K0MQQ7_9ROSA|nr:hypothetical protein FNV43_RR05510 [Rhamnella rubrinervis]